MGDTVSIELSAGLITSALILLCLLVVYARSFTKQGDWEGAYAYSRPHFRATSRMFMLRPVMRQSTSIL